MTSSPTVDGSATATFSGTNTGSVTLSTTKTNDVICIVVGHEKSSTTNSVSSITASGLTFVKRSSVLSTPGGSGRVYIEFWYATSTAILTSEVITVNLAVNTDDACIIAFGVNGAKSLSSPFDSNASLPGSSTAGAAIVASTSQADDLILQFTGTSSASGPNTPSGFSVIATVNNGGGALFYRAGAFSKSVNATQSSVSFPNGGGTVDVMLLDAITADAKAAIASVTQTFGTITQAVSAKHEFKASVSQSFGRVTQSVNAKISGHETVAQKLPKLSQSVQAKIRSGTTIAQTFKVISQHAVDKIRAAASVSQTFGKLSQQANASHHITASVSQSLPKLSQSVNATVRGNFETGPGYGYWLGPASNMIGMKNK